MERVGGVKKPSETLTIPFKESTQKLRRRGKGGRGGKDKRKEWLICNTVEPVLDICHKPPAKPDTLHTSFMGLNKDDRRIEGTAG